MTRSPLASFLFKGLATKLTTVKWTIQMVSGPSLTARDRGKTSTGYNISKKSYISFLFLKLLHFRNVQGFQKRKKIKKEK